MDVLRIITKADLTSSQKLMLMYILVPEFKDASQIEHADRLRMSVRCLGASLKGLRNKGYIVVKRGKYISNVGKEPDHYVPTRKARDLAGIQLSGWK